MRAPLGRQPDAHPCKARCLAESSQGGRGVAERSCLGFHRPLVFVIATAAAAAAARSIAYTEVGGPFLSGAI